MKFSLSNWIAAAGWAYPEVWYSGALREYGWFRSRRTRRATDRDGKPIPWFTYPAIHLLGERVQPSMRVFEYGGGQGSLWWMAKGVSLSVAEHDASWAKILEQNRIPVSVVPADCDSYSSAAVGRGLFDVVVIDGLHRERCVQVAASAVTDRGVLILDDSHRPELRPAIDTLRHAGWRWLPLRGPAPVSKAICETSIFYRDQNCLGL